MDLAAAQLSGLPSLRATLLGTQQSLIAQGLSQFPGSPVEVLTWLWAAVWGREAGQMSQSPGEEAAPRGGPGGGGQAGPLAGQTRLLPLGLAVCLGLGHSHGPG